MGLALCLRLQCTEPCAAKQNMIDPSRAIRCVNFEASVSMFLVNGILPVHSFVWTFCVIGL